MKVVFSRIRNVFFSAWEIRGLKIVSCLLRLFIRNWMKFEEKFSFEWIEQSEEFFQRADRIVDLLGIRKNVKVVVKKVSFYMLRTTNIRITQRSQVVDAKNRSWEGERVLKMRFEMIRNSNMVNKVDFDALKDEIKEFKHQEKKSPEWEKKLILYVPITKYT